MVRRPLVEASILIVLAAGIGFGSNALRRRSLPLAIPGGYYEVDSGAEAVFLDRARAIFEEGLAVFLDARPDSEYEAEQIDGAFSLPFERWRDLYPEILPWIEGRPVVVYAGTRNVSLADDLAAALLNGRQTGPVAVFFGGLEAWKAAGLPVRSGPDPSRAVSEEPEWREE